MAGVKSGFACLEDDIYSGSASPGNPAPSTATRSAAKLTWRVVGILARTRRYLNLFGAGVGKSRLSLFKSHRMLTSAVGRVATYFLLLGRWVFAA